MDLHLDDADTALLQKLLSDALTDVQGRLAVSRGTDRHERLLDQEWQLRRLLDQCRVATAR